MAPLTPVSYASMEGTGPSPFLCEGVATADYIAIPKVNQWSNHTVLALLSQRVSQLYVHCPSRIV